MTSLWKIAVPVAFVAVICGSATLWSADKKKATEQKLIEAARQCRVRAEQGDAKAQSQLGYMYYYGKGVPRDYTEAARWYRKAADQGYAGAQSQLGSMYYYGSGVPQDYAEAVRWYRKAADRGDAHAQYELGQMYEEGDGVPQDDAEATRWYRKAADQGDTIAEEALGSMYYYGKGMRQDYAEALRWYRKAADQGDAEAQYELGFMYDTGQGVAQDHDEAVRWFRKAADQGDAQAQRALGSGPKVAKRMWYFLLLIPFLGILWFWIDLLLRRKSLRDWPQKAAPLRKYLSSVFAVTSLVCLSIVLFGVLHPIRGRSTFLLLRSLLVPALFAPPAAIYGMAWWTALRGRPSARGWGIAASLMYALFSLWPIVLFWVWAGHAMLFAWGNFAVMLAIGVAGLVAFSRPYAQPAADPANLRISGDGTNDILNKVGEFLIFAGGLGAYFWWIRWLRATGIPANESIWSRTLMWMLVAVIATTLHELGHTAMGLALGMKLRAFVVGPLQWRIREGRWEFQFELKGIFLAGGATGVVPASADFSRLRHLCMTSAGPLVNLLTGMLALSIAFTVKGDSPAQTRGALALFGAWSLVVGVCNLLPFRTRDNYSDGAKIYQVLSHGPWGDFHRVVGAVTSSLVTPLRPRDYDIPTILRLEQTFTHGKEALLLRLHAYGYFLDHGRISEAGVALEEVESIYDSCAAQISAELLTVFVFGNAYVRRDAAAARQWWTRMEAKKPTRFNVDYWRAASALHWIEGNLKDANEAWEKSNALAQQLPRAGAYEFDRYCCCILRQALDEAPVAR